MIHAIQAQAKKRREVDCAMSDKQRKTQGEGCCASNDVAGPQRPFPVAFVDEAGHSSGIQDDKTHIVATITCTLYAEDANR